MDRGTPLLPHGQPSAYLTFAALTALGLPNATTTRHCPGVLSFDEPISAEHPVSPFRADAVRTLGAAGLDLARVSYAKQVHGAQAAEAPAAGGFAGTVDILVTGAHREPAPVHRLSPGALLLVPPRQSRPVGDARRAAVAVRAERRPRRVGERAARRVCGP